MLQRYVWPPSLRDRLYAIVALTALAVAVVLAATNWDAFWNGPFRLWSGALLMVLGAIMAFVPGPPTKAASEARIRRNGFCTLLLGTGYLISQLSFQLSWPGWVWWGTVVLVLGGVAGALYVNLRDPQRV